MDVSVLYKRAQRWLHGVARPAVFGNGMLERARATSLALLGFMAAVGLAIVALAANQGWPLIAGSSIPTIPPRHASVGPGIAVAGLKSPAARAEATPAGARHPGDARGAGHGGGAGPTAPARGPSDEIVVSPSVPTPPRGGDSPGAPKPPPKPAAKPTQPGAETPTTTAAPAPRPSTPPAAPAEPAPPTATGSEAPPESESHVPSWSHGHGHAYGRSGDEEGDD